MEGALRLRSWPTAALALLLAAGCSAPADSGQRPSLLRIGVPSPQAANSNLGLQNVIDGLTTETVVTLTADGRPGDRLATDWIWNNDRTTLHLKLRHDVLFHDGTALTPEIVAASLRRDVAAKNGLALSSASDIRVSDGGVDIFLPRRDAFLLEDLGVTSVRLPNAPAVGTGPYRLVKRGQVSQLEAFRRYYRGAPKIQNIAISSYPTQRSAWAAMMRGDVDMLQEVSRDAIDFVEAESEVRAFSFARPYYYLLGFNMRNPILANVEVRRALNEAVDKDTIVRDGMRGRGRPAADPIWPDLWAAQRGVQASSFNPEAAAMRLDSAGFRMKPADASAPPRRFTFTCLVWADDTRMERIALLLQKELYDVGVDMRLEPLALRSLLQRLMKGDYDAFLFEMANGRTLSWVYMFWHSPRPDLPTYNFTGYTAADNLLDRIREARSDDEIRASTADLEQVFHDNPPAVFLAWQTQARAVSTKFAVVTEPNKDIFSTIWQWQPVPPQQVAAK